MKKNLRLSGFLLFVMLSVTGAFAMDYVAIVGDGCPAGWNPSGIQLAQDGSTFTYEGALSVGEIKFHLVNDDWCVGRWIQALNNGDALSSTPSAYQITNGCDLDNKWYNSTDGSYKITIDTVAGTIMMEEFTSTYSSNQGAMFAPGSFNGWSGSSNTMSLIADYTWKTSSATTLAAGDYEMKFANSADWSGDDWGNAIGLTGTSEVTTGGGANITFTIVTAGDYLFMFNDETLEYSISEQVATAIKDLSAAVCSIYPNPASDKLCIASDQIIVDITIRDLSGKTIERVNIGSESGMINTCALQSGIYLIETITTDQKSNIQKLVIRN